MVDDQTGTVGMVAVDDGNVWYESIGNGPETIVLLHGGPGGSSDYLTALMELADDGYRVVRYDQLGSGKSDKPDDVSLWVVPRFVEELEQLRQELDLGAMHLLGQSWGVFLALEYTLKYPQHVRSLILYSGAASTDEVVVGMNQLRTQLSDEEQAILDRHEGDGTVEDEEYKAVLETLYKRHLCQIRPIPPELLASMLNMSLPVYHTMWGPNEFVCVGNLRDWDVRDRLGEITAPTLITNGRHDEVVPACGQTMHEGIPGSRFVVFENSSHHAHVEERDAYFALLREFLSGVSA